jgi:hypothetical protein
VKFSRLEIGLMTLLTILVSSTAVILIAFWLVISRGSCGAAKFLDYISFDNIGTRCFCDPNPPPNCLP